MGVPVFLGNNGGGGNTTVVTSLGSGVSAGSIALLFVLDNEATPPTTAAAVTDTKSNTWHIVDTAISIINSTEYFLVFYSIITNALTTSDTISFTANSASGPTTGAWSLAGYSTYDSGYTNAAMQASGSPATITGAQTAAAANEINIAWINGNNGNTTSPTGTWTAFVSFTTAFSSTATELYYFVNTGTSAQTFSANFSGADYGALIFSFYTPAVTTPVLPRRNVIRATRGFNK